MSPKMEKRLKQIEKALAKSSVRLSLPLKLKMAELTLRLMQRRKKFGLFIILGWKNQWKKYADTPDASQDIFTRRRINIMKLVPGQARRDSIVNTINFDGAILIDSHGNILHSGTMIEGLRPRATAHQLNPHRTPDLSSQFGFKRKVHMRHIAAITSSHLFHDTTIFTVSEENDDLHIFEGGKIVYSTVRGEPTR